MDELKDGGYELVGTNEVVLDCIKQVKIVRSLCVVTLITIIITLALLLKFG